MRTRLTIQCFSTQHQFTFSGSPTPQAAQNTLRESIQFAWQPGVLTAYILRKPVQFVIADYWDSETAELWFWHSFQIVKTEQVAERTADKMQEGKDLMDVLFSKFKYR